MVPSLQGAKHPTIAKSDHANLRSFTLAKGPNPVQTRWAKRLGKFELWSAWQDTIIQLTAPQDAPTA
jgi:hypothetical protein